MMRKIAFILVLVAGLAARADAPDGLLVTTPTGATQLAVADVQQVEFTDAQMQVSLADGTVLAFATADGWEMTFNDKGTQGVSSITADLQGSPVEVYDVNGVKVAEGMSPCLRTLPKGVYIVVQGDRKFKLIR